MLRLRRVLGALWRGLREWSGDAAYETYVRRAGPQPLSREEFWLDSQRRRYERVSRCC